MDWMEAKTSSGPIGEHVLLLYCSGSVPFSQAASNYCCGHREPHLMQYNDKVKKRELRHQVI